jgi:polyhydroxyalkanoate synthesis regulator phasin
MIIPGENPAEGRRRLYDETISDIQMLIRGQIPPDRRYSDAELAMLDEAGLCALRTEVAETKFDLDAVREQIADYRARQQQTDQDNYSGGADDDEDNEGNCFVRSVN